MNHKQLAKKIAKYLFTEGMTKEHAQRLVLEFPGKGITQTGWSELAKALASSHSCVLAHITYPTRAERVSIDELLEKHGAKYLAEGKNK